MGVLAKVTKNLYLSQRMPPLNSKGRDIKRISFVVPTITSAVVKPCYLQFCE